MKSQWLSGKVTAFHVEDCGSSPGLGAEARSGEAREESPDGGASPGEREGERRRGRKKVREKRREKKVLFNSKYLDLKHNLCLFSSLSWQIQILHLHLLPDPPVLRPPSSVLSPNPLRFLRPLRASVSRPDSNRHPPVLGG